MSLVPVSPPSELTMQKCEGFLVLDAVIRLEIYGYVLAAGPGSPNANGDPERPLDADTIAVVPFMLHLDNFEVKQLALVAVCRQLYHEVSAFLWKKKTFRFPSFEDMLKFLTRPNGSLPYVQKIEVGTQWLDRYNRKVIRLLAGTAAVTSFKIYHSDAASNPIFDCQCQSCQSVTNAFWRYRGAIVADDVHTYDKLRNTDRDWIRDINKYLSSWTNGW